MSSTSQTYRMLNKSMLSTRSHIYAVTEYPEAKMAPSQSVTLTCQDTVCGCCLSSVKAFTLTL